VRARQTGHVAGDGERKYLLRRDHVEVSVVHVVGEAGRDQRSLHRCLSLLREGTQPIPGTGSALARLPAATMRAFECRPPPPRVQVGAGAEAGLPKLTVQGVQQPSPWAIGPLAQTLAHDPGLLEQDVGSLFTLAHRGD
jgi:hypothetical protein